MTKNHTTQIVSIEDRLIEKAILADNTIFPEKSLGQMSREERHKLLYKLL